MLSLLFAAALIEPAPAKIVGHKFSDPASGFSVSKPPDWEFTNAPKPFGLKLKNDSVTAALDKTLVVFSRKPARKDFFGVKPTVSVERLNLPAGKTPTVWLTEEMKRQAAHDKY